MSKNVSADIRNGRFVVGTTSAEKFSAVEGQVRNARTNRILSESAARSETPEQLRVRVRTEFTRNK
jgi:hypothetical protein